MRTLSEIAVMEMHFQKILERTFVDVSEYRNEITDKTKRMYMYELQLGVVIGSIQVLGHMMEDHPHDLDGEDKT